MFFFFVGDGEVLNNICDNEDIVALCDHLRKHCIVDVYVENVVELDANKEGEVGAIDFDANK